MGVFFNNTITNVYIVNIFSNLFHTTNCISHHELYFTPHTIFHTMYMMFIIQSANRRSGESEGAGGRGLPLGWGRDAYNSCFARSAVLFVCWVGVFMYTTKCISHHQDMIVLGELLYTGSSRRRGCCCDWWWVCFCLTCSTTIDAF